MTMEYNHHVAYTGVSYARCLANFFTVYRRYISTSVCLVWSLLLAVDWSHCILILPVLQSLLCVA